MILPKITVVIPLYNKRSHILDCLHSVLQQSYAAQEVIVMDDGSSDGGAELIENTEFDSATEIRVIKQKNQGVSAARNNGVKEAKYDYVAFLDADDVWLPFFLEEMVNLHQRFPNVGFYTSKYQCVAAGEHYQDAKINMALVEENGFDPLGMLLNNYFDIAGQGDLPFMVSSSMISKKLFKKVGGFPVGEAIGEDQDLFAKIALLGPVAYSPNIHLLYTVDAENKATQFNIPSAECPFSKRLNKAKVLKKNKRAKSILKYCAAHLCHIAKLNIKVGRVKEAKRLLADPRCQLKPKHRIGLYAWALATQLMLAVKQLVHITPITK